MGYYTNDSEQYSSWNKVSSFAVLPIGRRFRSRVQLQDTSKKDGFTTEGLAFGAQYEVRLFDPSTRKRTCR